MNLTLKPTSRLSRLFNDWLRPDSISENDLFDLETGVIPMRLGVNVPSVNIKETPKEYTLEVAAPGMERKDFHIEVDNHNLKISAEKEEKTESNDYSRREYSYNSFCRSFSLPDNIKEGDIDAKYEKGILTIHVPKAKETQFKPVHKIDVT
jgi:HSP20 family protein